MFAKSILAKTAIVAVAAFAAHGLAPLAAPASSAAALAQAPAPGDDLRLPVAADTGAEVTVRFGDLDLASPQGARAMRRRIDNAAAQVCGGQAPCERQAIATAVASLASPPVAAVSRGTVRLAERD
jgi:UrcA family protein